MKILLINGKAQSGKSLLAEKLASKLSNAKCYHNADAVKSIAKAMYSWDGIKDDKGRELLISITNKGYSLDKYYWEACNSVTMIHDNVEVAIIPDFRYMNTYNYFKEHDSMDVYTIYIAMDKDINDLNEIMKNDSSEVKLDIDFDIELINEYGNEELLDKYVDEIILKISN